MEVLRRKKMLVGVAVGAVVLVAYAWFDGGSQSVHTITQDLAVPGESK
jgi:hypothetical protein